MARQLLRDSKIVINYAGRSYEMRATSAFSADTTLQETTGRRKTLFSNTPKQYSVTNQITPSSITLSVLLTDKYLERIFFDILGLENAGEKFFLPHQVPQRPKLFSMQIISKDTTFECRPCFIEAIDITLSKETALTLGIQIQAGSIKRMGYNPKFDSSDYTQSSPIPPKPVYLGLDGLEKNSITSATISLQQIAAWREGKTLFNVYDEDTYSETAAYTSDIILSSTVYANYESTWSEENTATDTDLVLSKGYFGLTIEKARIIHSVDFSSIYNNRLDVSYSETSGEAFFNFGE